MGIFGMLSPYRHGSCLASLVVLVCTAAIAARAEQASRASSAQTGTIVEASLRETMEAIIDRALERIGSAEARVEAAVSAGGPITQYTPELLVVSDYRAAAFSRLQELVAAIDHYRSTATHTFDLAEEEIESSGLSASDEREQLAELRKVRAKFEALSFPQLRDLSTLTVTLISIVELIDATDPPPEVIDGRLKFPTAEKEAEFQPLAAELVAVLERIQAHRMEGM